jgi:N-acetylglucosamine-6-phosphate deacetylase
MSMHLEGPWLTTTGKMKSKRKFASAEHARKARDLEESWNELLKRQGVEQEERKRQRAMKAEPLVYNLGAPPGRTTSHIPSRNTGEVGTHTYKASPQYTGTKVKGIGTMHKSNAVPIFSNEEAVEISTMRR